MSSFELDCSLRQKICHFFIAISSIGFHLRRISAFHLLCCLFAFKQGVAFKCSYIYILILSQRRKIGIELKRKHKRNCVMITIPNIYFLHNDSVTSFHSSVLECLGLAWLGYGWNATPKTAQSNTLLINNITFNMVNNSKNALCIFCCDADRCHTVNARVVYGMAIVVRMKGDIRQTIERIIIYLIWCGMV